LKFPGSRRSGSFDSLLLAPALATLLALGALPDIAFAQAAARVYVVPDVLTLSVGEQATVEVHVEGIPESGLAAFQLELQSDDSLVGVDNPNEAFRGLAAPFAPLGDDPTFCETVRGVTPCPDPTWLLVDTGREPLGVDRIEPARSLFAYGTSGVTPPPSSDGVIAVVTVTGTQQGASLVELPGAILADASEVPVPHSLVADPLIVITDGAGLPDDDSDGIPDAVDNCTLAANGPDLPDVAGNAQLDSDRDGYGNLCDCDLNNDGICGQPDYSILLACFGRLTGPGTGPLADPACEESDMNGDGAVGQPDYSLFLVGFGGEPGPSGRMP